MDRQTVTERELKKIVKQWAAQSGVRFTVSEMLSGNEVFRKRADSGKQWTQLKKQYGRPARVATSSYSSTAQADFVPLHCSRVHERVGFRERMSE